MTWAIFAIDWMEVALQPGNAWTGNFSRATAFFRRGYANVQVMRLSVLCVAGLPETTVSTHLVIGSGWLRSTPVCTYSRGTGS